MKKIPKPENITAVKLRPADMNKIHFGGNGTPLTLIVVGRVLSNHSRKI